MDPLLLIAAQNAIKCTNQREAFDRLMQPLNHNDPNGYIRKSLDILKGANQSIVHPYDFIYSSVFVARETMISQSLQLWLQLFCLINIMETL